MGLFDNMNDPVVQAKLMMAAGLLAPVRNKGWRGAAEAAGQGLQQGLLGYTTGARTQEAVKRGEMERQLEQARLDQMKQAQEAQAYMGQGIGKFMSPGVTPATAVDDSGNAMPSSPPSFNQAGFANYLAQNPATAAQALQYMPQPQAPQFKEVGGRLVKIDGGNVSEAYAPPAKPAFQQGQTREIKSGRTVITQEWDGQKWNQIAKSAMDKPDDDGGLGKPMPGYRWRPDGGLEPIPGGPADTKVGKEAEALGKRQEGALQRADFVLGKVGDAIKKTGVTTSGTLGALMKNVPGSDARALQRILDPIKANIGFAELQAMREASPTGGALGQVAVQELAMLQSVLGSLEQDQPSEELLKSLYSIEKHFNNWKRAVQAAKSTAKQEGEWSIKRAN